MLHRRHPSLARNGNVEVEELRGWGGCCLHWALLWDGLPLQRPEWKENSQRGALSHEPRDLPLFLAAPSKVRSGHDW